METYAFLLFKRSPFKRGIFLNNILCSSFMYPQKSLFNTFSFTYSTTSPSISLKATYLSLHKSICFHISPSSSNLNTSFSPSLQPTIQALPIHKYSFSTYEILNSNSFHPFSNRKIRQHSSLNNISPLTAHLRTHIRLYHPQKHINWKNIRFRVRVNILAKKKTKLKDNPDVAQRFRLTRFGWEHLHAGLHSPKRSWDRAKWKRMKEIGYVSRHDLKKFKSQLPNRVLRIRDPPIDYNPNIRKIRSIIPSHFG